MAEEVLTSKQKDLMIRRLDNELAEAKRDLVKEVLNTSNWRLESGRFKDKWVESERLLNYWHGRFEELNRPILQIALAVAWLALFIALAAVSYRLGHAC